MRRELEETEEGPAVRLPVDWTGDVDVRQPTADSCVVRRVDEDGSVPPIAIETHNRPILVDVSFGRSGLVGTPQDAVRFGYRESEFRAEFYYLDILEEPKWVQITEDTTDPKVGIRPFVDEWVVDGELTAAEGEWARAQFE